MVVQAIVSLYSDVLGEHWGLEYGLALTICEIQILEEYHDNLFGENFVNLLGFTQTSITF